LQADTQLILVIIFVTWLFFVILHLQRSMKKKKLRAWEFTGIPLIFFALQLIGMIVSIIYLSTHMLDVFGFFTTHLINYILFMLAFIFSARNDVYAIVMGSVFTYILTIYAIVEAYVIASAFAILF